MNISTKVCVSDNWRKLGQTCQLGWSWPVDDPYCYWGLRLVWLLTWVKDIWFNLPCIPDNILLGGAQCLINMSFCVFVLYVLSLSNYWWKIVSHYFTTVFMSTISMVCLISFDIWEYSSQSVTSPELFVWKSHTTVDLSVLYMYYGYSCSYVAQISYIKQQFSGLHYQPLILSIFL